MHIGVNKSYLTGIFISDSLRTQTFNNPDSLTIFYWWQTVLEELEYIFLMKRGWWYSFFHCLKMIIKQSGWKWPCQTVSEYPTMHTRQFDSWVLWTNIHPWTFCKWVTPMLSNHVGTCGQRNREPIFFMK